MQDFTGYPSKGRDGLVEILCDVTSQLVGLAEELAMIQAAEKRARAQGFMGSSSETLGGRERDAEFNSLDLTCTVFELRGRIRALEEERDLLRLLIDLR